MPRVPVKLGQRSYLVHIGHGELAGIAHHLARFRDRKIVVVSSPKVFEAHGATMMQAVRAWGAVKPILMPDGERNKTLRTMSVLQDRFLREGLGRDGVVLAFGGGVVGDVTGFAAATYMRGVDWVQIPTTLLAMVDASIGGKVGVNHKLGKNLVGAFHQPRAVVSDLDLLETLPERQLQSAAYEILKCGLVGAPELFCLLEQASERVREWFRATLQKAVLGACHLKADVVARDEREGGLRRVLNLGHTLGHALEAATGYRRFLHGEAVGWGLLGAADIARARGLLSLRAHAAVVEAVRKLGALPRMSDVPASDILEALTHDKKARGGQVAFVLPTGIGRVRIVTDISMPEIRAALGALGRHERVRSGRRRKGPHQATASSRRSNAF